MRDTNNQNDQFVVPNLVQHAMISNTNSAQSS